MADMKEDRIDFAKLEVELEQAVEKDARYWRENDAKFRAVEQRVESYEQFRDIVAAAHIKPLEKKDKMGAGQRNQPWNPFTTKTAGPQLTGQSETASQKTDQSETASPKETFTQPRTSVDFSQDWKRNCRSSGDKYAYLEVVGAEQLGRIFRAEIGSCLLGEIVTVLNEQLQIGDTRHVVDVLTGLADANRFELSLDFLSRTEVEHCKQLFGKLEEGIRGMETENSTSMGSNPGAVCVEEKQHGLKKQLHSLRTVYNL